MTVDSPPRERPGFGGHDHPYPYSAFSHIRDSNVRKFVESLSETEEARQRQKEIGLRPKKLQLLSAMPELQTDQSKDGPCLLPDCRSLLERIVQQQVNNETERLQLQDKMDALREELENRKKALQSLDEEGKQALTEQNRLRETFQHYTSKESKLGEELKLAKFQQNDIRKKIGAAEAEKVRLKQQLLLSTSKSTHASFSIDFTPHEIPTIVFSPVAKRRQAHSNGRGSRRINTTPASPTPPIDQRFIELFGKDLPPLLGADISHSGYSTLSSHGVVDFVERAPPRPTTSGPPRALWFPRESERVTETASIYTAFSRSVSPPRTATIKQPLQPKAYIQNNNNNTRRIHTSWERKRSDLRTSASLHASQQRQRPGTSAMAAVSWSKRSTANVGR